jgi:hypothetical protein
MPYSASVEHSRSPKVACIFAIAFFSALTSAMSLWMRRSGLWFM